MSIFKTKYDKTKHSIQINTLDDRHKKTMDHFHKQKLLLPIFKQKLEILEQKLKEAMPLMPATFNHYDIYKIHEIIFSLNLTEKELPDITQYTINQILDAGSVLYKEKMIEYIIRDKPELIKNNIKNVKFAKLAKLFKYFCTIDDVPKLRSGIKSFVKSEDEINDIINILTSLTPPIIPPITLFTFDDVIKLRSDLHTTVKELKDEIYDIENNISEMAYYGKTEDIIMKYYEILDQDDHTLYENNPELHSEKKVINLDLKPDKLDLLNKNIVVDKKVIKREPKRRKKLHNFGSNTNILSFFDETKNDQNIDDTGSEIETETDVMINTEINISSLNNNNIVAKNKADLLDQYMMFTDTEYVCDKKRTGVGLKKCPECGIEKTLVHAEGILVCAECGQAEIIIIDSEKPNYKESVSDAKPGYPYKRINHFNELLSQFQAC